MAKNKMSSCCVTYLNTSMSVIVSIIDSTSMDTGPSYLQCIQTAPKAYFAQQRCAVTLNFPVAAHTPSQIFGDGRCAGLGFPVVSDDFRQEREKLGIRDHPGASQLVEKLVTSPPNTIESQETIFEYMSTQIDSMYYLSRLENCRSFLQQELDTTSWILSANIHSSLSGRTMKMFLWSLQNAISAPTRK
jgi:hypothetical protein